MSTLVEFLLARIADTEEAARFRLAQPRTRSPLDERLLVECGMKRRILAALDLTPCPCQRAERCVIHDASAGPPEFARERYVDPRTDEILAAMSVPYADRPDFRPEWRLDA